MSMTRTETYEALVQALAQCRELANEIKDWQLSDSVEDARLRATRTLRALEKYSD